MTQATSAACGARPAICFIAGFLSAVGISVTSPALAGANDWHVSDIQGDARLRVGASTSWKALNRGDEILPGGQVETRERGRLLLVRRGDTINVYPNSRFIIPLDAGRVSTLAHPTTHVIQKIGTLLFKITAKPDKPFSVKTPEFTAIIKGSIFTIAVKEQNSALHVSSGAVQVSSILNGDLVLVRPGQTAAVGRTDGGRLQLVSVNRTTGRRNSDDGKVATGGITAADLASGGRSRRSFKTSGAVGALGNENALGNAGGGLSAGNGLANGRGIANNNSIAIGSNHRDSITRNAEIRNSGEPGNGRLKGQHK